MINKQKVWFLTLFSLILVLGVYYITMPSDLLKTASKLNDNKKETKVIANVKDSSFLEALQVEKDEERQAMQAEYNEILTNKDASTEDKNNAYEGLKRIDEVKSLENKLQDKIKNNMKLDSFVKIDGNNISVTIDGKKHDYSLANKIMRLIQEDFKNKMYISVRFQK